MSQQFYYDSQIRRVLLQVIRIFGEFTVQDGSGAETKVPAAYGDPSLSASSILTDNTANMMQSVPRIAAYISSMKINRGRTQNPTFIRKQSVRTRQFDPSTQSYLPLPGNAYTVEKITPIPIDLDMKVDIWTSNTNQKLQLLEQILPLFNPAMEIQFTDQYFDWTSLSTIELIDINWSNRAVPVGTNATDPTLDVCTLTFSIPIWISLAANVSKLNVIFKVIQNLFDANGSVNSVTDFVNKDDLLLGTRQVVTFHNYGLFLKDNQMELLARYQLPTSNNALDPGEIVTQTIPWPSVLDKYGNIIPGVSEIRLNFDGDNNANANIGNIIVGTIQVDSANANILLYTPDSGTLPINTLNPIEGTIDPQLEGPNITVSGTRYLISNNIGNIGDTYYQTAWAGNLIAHTNDIIQYNGSIWTVSFDSENNSNTQFVTDLQTLLQYRWTGKQWTKSYEGFYPPSSWSIVV